MTSPIQSYENGVSEARRRLSTSGALKALLDPSFPVSKLEAFFIYYNALGVKMTENVEGWIRRAGQRCVELGYRKLGNSLIAHARHEAGHHLMMVQDTRYLVTRWNDRLGTSLSAEDLLATPATEGVRRYIALHEQTIGGEAPFGQLAIEYEIERLSVDLGAPVLERCIQALGPAAMSGLSFLQEHVEVDIGHTKLNAAALSHFLEEFPALEGALIRKGEEALAAYGEFVDDCFALSDALVTSGRVTGSAA